jgi:hypothetical protein
MQQCSGQCLTAKNDPLLARQSALKKQFAFAIQYIDMAIYYDESQWVHLFSRCI